MKDTLSAERVRRIWNWLPVFRVVAETEHLPTASDRLYVTPSALSRTIQLLEEQVGRPLFHRTGRSIRLNAAGESLLARVRDGMRIVHRGILEACDETLVGSLRIYSAGVITPTHVEPALAQVRLSYPRLVVSLRTILKEGVVEDLLRGRIDIALQSEPVVGEHVEMEHLGDASNGVYCGPGHPLHDGGSPTLDEIFEHPFVAPVPDESGRTNDGWPVKIPRKIGLFTDHMAVGIRQCASGGMLAVLPDSIGHRHGLRRLPMEGIPDSPLYAIHRVFLTEEGRTELFLNLVREDIASGRVPEHSPPGPASRLTSSARAGSPGAPSAPPAPARP